MPICWTQACHYTDHVHRNCPGTLAARARLPPGHACRPGTLAARARLPPGHAFSACTLAAGARFQCMHACRPGTLSVRARFQCMHAACAKAEAGMPCRWCLCVLKSRGFERGFPLYQVYHRPIFLSALLGKFDRFQCKIYRNPYLYWKNTLYLLGKPMNKKP